MQNGDDDALDDTSDGWGTDEPVPDGPFPPPHEVLRGNREDTPTWLAGSRFDAVQNFLNSRVVFYPGSATDGHAIKVFGGSHNAHCFVHADLSVRAADVLEQLQPGHPKHLSGYHPEVGQIIAPVDLTDLLRLDLNHPIADQEPQLQDAVWALLRRDNGFGDEHGPERLAFLHVCADAFWVFWNLWVRHDRAPHAILLEDYGFGGNYAHFGGPDSPMYRLANPRALPDWLLVGPNTARWPGYEAASDLTEPAGLHHRPRRLFRLTR